MLILMLVTIFQKIKKEIETILFDVTDVYELIPKVEKILIRNYNIKHENTLVLQAVEKILKVEALYSSVN